MSGKSRIQKNRFISLERLRDEFHLLANLVHFGNGRFPFSNHCRIAYHFLHSFAPLQQWRKERQKSEDMNRLDWFRWECSVLMSYKKVEQVPRPCQKASRTLVEALQKTCSCHGCCVEHGRAEFDTYHVSGAFEGQVAALENTAHRSYGHLLEISGMFPEHTWRENTSNMYPNSNRWWQCPADILSCPKPSCLE